MDNAELQEELEKLLPRNYDLDWDKLNRPAVISAIIGIVTRVRGTSFQAGFQAGLKTMVKIDDETKSDIKKEERERVFGKISDLVSSKPDIKEEEVLQLLDDLNKE